MTINDVSDIDRALSIYQFIAATGDEERLAYAVFAGNPVSKHRARHAGGRTFTTEGQKEAQETLGNALRSAIGEPFRGNVAVGCIFYRRTQQPVDVDNLLKHVLDSATGVAWLDDRQVTAVIGILECDPDRPRTVIVIGRHDSSLVRDTLISGVCEYCGAAIEHPSWRKTKQRFCSPACTAKSRGEDLSEPVACRQCGELFNRGNARQVLCSESCRTAWLSGKRKAEAQPNFCVDCGTQTPNYRATRCRACWRKAKKTGLVTSANDIVGSGGGRQPEGPRIDDREPRRTYPERVG